MRLKQDRRARTLARFQQTYPLGTPLTTKEEYQAKKLGLIAGIGKAESIRDFGGIWGVNGLYLLGGARSLGAGYAQMVDYAPTEEFLEGVEQLRADCGTTVDMTRADFRRPSLYDRLVPIDVSVLYDVLLHQDNAVEVIRNVTSTTRTCVCVAQPVLKEELFALPCGCVNVLFYPDELKDLIRCPYWPPEPAVEEFTTIYWTWGQTVSYLTSVFHGYGWERVYLEAYDMPPDWAYALMRFAPREAGDSGARADGPAAYMRRPAVGARTSSTRFTDVQPGSYGFAEIEACAKVGIVQGYADGSFSRGEVVTRGQLAVFLARALAGGEEQVPQASGAPSFTDVPADEWAFRYVAYLHEKGVVETTPEGRFEPLRAVTQEELAALVARAVHARGGEVAPEAKWQGDLKSGTVCTREDVAVTLARAFGLVG